MTTVTVFGHSGMLGRAVCEILKNSGIDLVTVGRQGAHVKFDVGVDSLEDLKLPDHEFAINCIGLISHLIDESNPSDRLKAASLNALFPHELAAYASSRGVKVIQIATDCVFSGSSGSYLESSHHDAHDLYGLSKSIGEVNSDHVMNLRASIIGREQRGFRSLLEWVLTQPENAEITGYEDRLWNGVTTLAFARIISGIIRQELFRGGLQHIVPMNCVTKAELLSQICEAFDRQDIVVRSQPSGLSKDLTLSTENPDFNSQLWSTAGYSQIPTIQQMIGEIVD